MSTPSFLRFIARGNRVALGLFALLIFSGQSVALKAQPSGNGAKNGAKGSLTFPKKINDLGSVIEGETATTEFTFTNTGKAPITLVNVQASCGCTMPEWERNPIAPGATSSIRTTFNSAGGHAGPFSKAILVTTDGEPVTYDLAIMGTIKPKPKAVDELYPYRMGSVGFDGMTMAFGVIKSNARGEARVKVYNFSDKPIAIKGFSSPKRMALAADKTTLQPGEYAVIKGNFNPSPLDGEIEGVFSFQQGEFRVLTDDAVQPEKKILFSANILEVFPTLSAEERAQAPKLNLRNTAQDLGEVPLGAKRDLDFPLNNAGFQDLKIRAVTASCGCTEARAERAIVAKRKSSRIKGTFHADTLGPFEKTITIVTNDPSAPIQQVVVRGTVVKAAE